MRSFFFFALALAACGANKPDTPSTPIDVAPAKKAPVTKGPREDICPASTALVRSLRGHVTVEAYVTLGHPRLDRLAHQLGDLLDRLATASNGKLTVKIIDTTKNEEARDKATEAGLVEREMREPDASEESTPYAKGFFGLVIAYGAERETIKALGPDSAAGLEFWVTTKLREVHDRVTNAKHRIGVVTDHGAIALDESNLVPVTTGQKPSIGLILRQYFPFHELVAVDLGGGERPIDRTLDGLLVLQPERDLADKELRAIDRFVMTGKGLAVVASAVNVAKSDVTMSATLSTHGLDRLTTGYGIEIAKDVVLDFGRGYRIGIVDSTGGAKSLIIPALLDERPAGGGIDVQTPIFFRLENVTFPFASSLVLHPERQPDAALHVIARSSERAMRETSGPIDLAPMRRWQPKGPFAIVPIAATATGKLRSAFEPGVSATKPARVVVIASSQLFANPLARAGNPPDNAPMGVMGTIGGDATLQQLAMPYAQNSIANTIFVAKALLDWLAYDDALGECALGP